MAKIRVEFLGPIGLGAKEMEASDLHELKNQLQEINELSEWLALSAVAINDEIIENLDHGLKDGDRVVLLPPVCGG